MTNQRKLEIKVGLVSFVSIILLIFGLSLGKGCNVTEKYQTIKFHFPNSGGITESSPVVVNGVKRGFVTSVQNYKDYVLVTANITNIEDIRSDAYAKVTILELTGGKKIEIDPGYSPQPFNPNLEIQGAKPYDIADVISLVGDLGSDATLLIRRLDSISFHINNAMANGRTVKQILEIVDNTAELTQSLNTGIGNNMGDITLIVKNLKSITNDLKSAIQDNRPRIESLVKKLDITTDTVQVFLSNANRAVSGAEQLIGELNNIAYSVKNGDGVVSKFLFDKQFSMKVDSTLNSLHQLAEFVRLYGINTNIRMGTRP
jgi:phospholipid/cholesterol/gamma-HCH transport system substrate-binding protein